MSPEERRRLRVLADEAEARAKEAKARGEALSALGFMELALMARSALDIPAALTPVTSDSRIRKDMEAEHRQKLSDARTDGDVPEMLQLARKSKKGIHTMADLAEALGYKRSMMSRVLRGDRGISEEAAKKFEELTGKPWRSKA